MLIVIFLFFTEILFANFRIATLDPASSDLVFALNLNKNWVAADAITQKDPRFQHLTPVSTGQKVDYEHLVSLKVTHVVAYDLGFSSLEKKLKRLGIQSLLLKNQKLNDLIENTKKLEKTFSLSPRLSSEFENQIQQIAQKHAKKTTKKITEKTYLLQIDFSPTYVVGQKTFLSEGFALCKFKNIVKKPGYLLWTKESALENPTQYIFVMSDVIKKQGLKKVQEHWQQINTKATIKVIDADSFSRLSPTFLKSLSKLCAEFF